MMERFGVVGSKRRASSFAEPFPLFDFVALERNAFCVLSDSGTVQEECCIFRVPNVTIRDVTERPETVEAGSNMLSGAEPDAILRCVRTVLANAPAWTRAAGVHRRGRERAPSRRSCSDIADHATAVTDLARRRARASSAASFDRLSMAETIARVEADRRGGAPVAAPRDQCDERRRRQRGPAPARDHATSARSSARTARASSGLRGCSVTRCPSASTRPT